MTIPSYLGVSTGQSTAAVTISVSLAAIAGGSAPSVGDLLLAHMVRGGVANDQHFDAPIGWHRLGGSQNGLGSSIFWKIREAGDSNTANFSGPINSADKIVAVHCIRGADQTRPICRHSIQRNSSDTFSWLAETTPVADCLAIASAASTSNRSGISPASGWTEQVDISQGSFNMYAQTSGIATSGTSTGTANATLSGSGATSLTQHMVVIQPPQTATPKDIRVATGTLTSPTATGDQDVTGLGFDCKALIIYSMRQDADAVAANVEYMHGIGADDGVTTRFQRSVGITQVSGSTTSIRGWNQDSIVGVFFAGNSVSDMLADYSRITDGFRLSWTKVPATGYAFNYIAFGGNDLQAVCGAQDGSASPLTALPWRPDMVHIVGQNFNSSANQLRSGSGTAQMSLGWLDPNAGAQWCATQELNGPAASLHDNSFYAQMLTGTLTYELSFSQATTTGWSWTGSDTDYFFYLAFNWGNVTYFPAQVEMLRADASGTAGATQVVPSLGRGQTFTTKKLVHSISGKSTTVATSSAGGVSEGQVKFSYAVVDQDVFGWGKTGSTGERRRKPNSSFLSAAAGDLDTPAKIGAWQDLATINWATNDAVGYLIGLFTLGFIGQQYDRQVDDTAAVTDSLSRVVVSVRSTNDTVAVTELLVAAVPYVRIAASDSVVVTDSIARALTRSRQASDTAAVTDSSVRTATYGRTPSDALVVTDSIARAVPFVRSMSDTAVASESLARTVTFGRKPTDTAIVTDSSVRTTTFGRTSTDTAVATESLARTATYGRKPSDTVTVTDSVSAKVAFGRVASDTLSIADALTRVANGTRAIFDAVVITDDFQANLAGLFICTVSDASVVADSFGRATNSVRTLIDTLAINVDALTANKVSHVTVSDGIAVFDALTATCVFARVQSDTVAVLDALVRTRDMGRTVFDAITFVDSISSSVARLIVVSDAIATVDALRRNIAFSRAAVDVAAVSDLITAVLGTGYALTTSNSVATSDSVARALAYVRVPIDTVTTVDSIEIEQIGIEVETSDSVTTSDVVRKATAVGKSLLDVIASAELVIVQRTYGGAARDVIIVTDDLSVDVYTLSVDAVAVTESLGRRVAYARALSDAMVVEDSCYTADVVFVLQGTGDGANVGPLVISAVEDTGPLSISGGPDLSTGPVGFVMRPGDFVAVTDQIVRGASLVIEVGDLVEVG